MNRFIDINPERCIGCGTCLSACSDAHRAQGLQSAPRLALVKTETISAAVTCHHCEGAPCAEVCPVNAISREADRIHVNEQTCIGCRLCAIACPFGAIHPDGTSIAGVAGMCEPTPFYPSSLSSLLTWAPGVYTCAVKCDLCEFDETGPHCVAACPTNALTVVGAEEDAALDEAKRLRSIAGDADVDALAIYAERAAAGDEVAARAVPTGVDTVLGERAQERRDA